MKGRGRDRGEIDPEGRSIQKEEEKRKERGKRRRREKRETEGEVKR